MTVPYDSDWWLDRQLEVGGDPIGMRYRNGTSVRSLAELYGVGWDTVKRRLLIVGISEYRGYASNGRKVEVEFTPADEAWIYRALCSGATVNAVVVLYRCSPKRVRRLARRFGATPRGVDTERRAVAGSAVQGVGNGR